MTSHEKVLGRSLRILVGIPLLLLIAPAGVSAETSASQPMLLAQAQQEKPLEGNREAITKQVQEELKKRGYYDGPVDGTLSPKTRAAAMRFQSDAGLSVSGSVNEELLNALKTADEDIRRKSS